MGVSKTELWEICHRLGIKANVARDFMRVLRAVWRASIEHAPPSSYFDHCDYRTLKDLLTRGGVVDQARPSIEHFLRSQSFIPPDNRGLLAQREELGMPNVFPERTNERTNEALSPDALGQRRGAPTERRV